MSNNDINESQIIHKTNYFNLNKCFIKLMLKGFKNNKHLFKT